MLRIFRSPDCLIAKFSPTAKGEVIGCFVGLPNLIPNPYWTSGAIVNSVISGPHGT